MITVNSKRIVLCCQFFLSPNRAIYLLLWNVRLGHEHAGLDFWLSSIGVQAPKAPVFVIGSHIDQVSYTSVQCMLSLKKYYIVHMYRTKKT